MEKVGKGRKKVGKGGKRWEKVKKVGKSGKRSHKFSNFRNNKRVPAQTGLKPKPGNFFKKKGYRDITKISTIIIMHTKKENTKSVLLLSIQQKELIHLIQLNLLIFEANRKFVSRKA